MGPHLAVPHNFRRHLLGRAWNHAQINFFAFLLLHSTLLINTRFIFLGGLTCITLIGRPVSFASCSRMCRVGFGVCEKAVFRISNCFAFIVVRGPLRFEPAPLSSGLLFSVWESRVSGSPSREFWSSESS